MPRLTDLIGDLRVSFRQLLRRPLYAVLGVGTLALGIGATVALSSVAVGLLLRPLPVADEGRLHVFWSDFDWRGVEFDFVKERQRAFSGLAAYSVEGYTLRINDQSSTVVAGVTSAELFDVLGVGPLMGRAFRAGDDRPGAAPITVLSYGFWQQELGGDTNVIGRSLEIDGAQVQVVGVMPRGFYFPTPQIRVWRPLVLDPASGSYQGNGWLVLIGRERDGLASGELNADVQAIARALGGRFTYPEAWDKTRGAHVTALRDYAVGAVRPAVLLLQFAVVLVLAIACANVAALVLARTTDRGEELALRAALGASRGRLVRQLVVESIAMSLLAGVLGAGLSVIGFQTLVAQLPLADGLGDTLRLDWALLAIALGVSALAGLVVAVAPMRALLSGRVAGPSRDRSAASRPHSGSAYAHRLLVTVQVGLAVLLVAGAMVFARSVQRLYAIDPGFEAADVVAIDLVAPTTIMDQAARQLFFDRVTERVSQLPGVQDAGLITRLPLRDGGWQGTLTIEDRPDLGEGREPNALFRIVSAGFFPAMGIAITHGRPFSSVDGRSGQPAGIVSASFAAKMWPGRDPLGRRVRHTLGGQPVWVTVVGVAEETRMVRLTGDNPMVLYVPLAQASALEGAALVVKGGGAPPSTPAVRAAVREIDSRVAVGRVTTVEAVVAGALAEPLRLRFFLSVLGALALVIGATGIYSVVSYSVSRRRTEFGVRLALGAAPGRILTEVVAAGLAPVAVGVVAGLAGTLAVGSMLQRFLYGVAPADAVSLVATSMLLLGVGVVAAVAPAIRAGRTDPVEALRAE